METPVALNIPPLNAPHRELEWKALGDKDYRITEIFSIKSKFNIHMLNELKPQHLSGADIVGIWDSNLPIFNLPQVNVLPNLIHRCCENYDPCQRVVLSPSGSVLFHITPEAINEMLHFHTAKPLTPLHM